MRQIKPMQCSFIMLTVITKSAVSAPERTMDFGWRIAISAAIIKVSSPI